MSSRDAIDHFAATTCCFAVTTARLGEPQVYAPHGYEDLFDGRVRPNPVLAPPNVYEAKTQRWQREWPFLKVEPWPTGSSALRRRDPPGAPAIEPLERLSRGQS